MAELLPDKPPQNIVDDVVDHLQNITFEEPLLLAPEFFDMTHFMPDAVDSLYE